MLTLLTGSDGYRLRTALDAYIGEIHTAHPGAPVIRADCGTPDGLTTVERTLKYPSFFDACTVLVLIGAASADVRTLLTAYDIDTLSSVSVFIVCTDEKPNAEQKRELAKLERLANRTQKFEPLAGTALAAWVRAFCDDRGVSIEPSAVAALIARTGPSTWALAMELEKLCAWAGGEPVTRVAVHVLVPERRETDPWQLSNALAAYDKRAAARALWRSLLEGQEPHLVLALFAGGIRTLTQVCNLTQQGIPTARIASRTGLHPYVVSKTAQGARTADLGRLTGALVALADLEQDAKRGGRDTVDGLFSVLFGL